MRELGGSIIGIIIIGTEVTAQVIARKKMEARSIVVHNLLVTVPAFVCILNGPDHVFDFANTQYQSLFGQRQLMGHPLFEAIPELKGQDIEQILTYQSGEPYLGVDVPILVAREEDTTPEMRYFNFGYQPLFDENETVYAILVFGNEVTDQVLAKSMESKIQERRAAELEERVQQRTRELTAANELLRQKNQEIEDSREKMVTEYARSLIEASLDPLITISTEGKIMDMNQALATVTGKTRAQLISSDFTAYFTEPEKAREIYQRVFEQGFVENYPLVITDHKLTDVLFNGSVYKDGEGNVLGAVVVARDITSQKQIEKELTEAKISADLARELAEDAQGKAENATIVAENAVKSKQQFLSNMSHEIRTPMNAIIGFTKVLLKAGLPEKQKEYLTAIKLSGDALIVLINDILDLAKVDAGKMSFEKTPFKLAFSISAILHLFEAKIQEKNLVLVKEYDYTIPMVLMGDPVRLHQIVMNLLSNAVKFTSVGKIKISVRMLEEDDERVLLEFAVSDTGIGIAEAQIETIFENFQQASSATSRLYGGTGLGLAIAKQLVEQQGGSILVESKLDIGSTFSFVLPFQKTIEDPEVVIEIMELDAETQHINVLVVEDMALNQLLVKTLLDEFGFKGDIVSNGKLALEKLVANTYDIVLMDLQMPEMNGFEATEYIRNEMHSSIPIIALTADVTTVDLEKCKAVGMNDYISKPIDERVLYSKIVGLVKKASRMASREAEEPNPQKLKCTDLEYLTERTKNNPDMLTDIIIAYLEQTPALVRAMKEGMRDKDWHALHAAVHKMIPSFAIMGINRAFENMAKKIQEFARTQEESAGIPDLILQLENVCTQACKELEEDLNRIKKART
ncbi:MAG: response regulator [Bacteroidetes bacterium]|nr:MAG: response regulator [Bacteroidota bacterium]